MQMHQAQKTREFIDIGALINNNPLTKLSSDYNSKIIKKICNNFNNDEQQIFVVNFYCYLNYNPYTSFVIRLDQIYEWLGYSCVGDCKRCLKKYFVKDLDYEVKKAVEIDKISVEKNVYGGAGLNKEYIYLTIDCFKRLCQESRTEKARKIRGYYVKLEMLVHELLEEQNTKLIERLQNKDKEIEDLKKANSGELTKLEKNLVQNYKNQKLVYLGFVEENIVKFGVSNNIEKRILDHKNKFGPQFTLKYAVLCEQNRDLEDLIKNECKREGSVLYNRRISKKYNSINQTELIKLDSKFMFEDLYKEVLILRDKCTQDHVKELKKEIATLRSAVYVEPVKKEVVLNKEEEEKIKLLINTTKCSRCGHVGDVAKFGINKNTGQAYSLCIECKTKTSEENFAKTEETRLKNEKEFNTKQQKIEEQRQLLLNQDKTFKCSWCHLLKTPKEFDINKRNGNTLYKVCTQCRNDKMNKKIVVEEEIESTEEENTEEEEEYCECTKCHKDFKREYNKVTRKYYKTCEECREKDLNRSKKMEENKNLLSDPKITIITCSCCTKPFPKELNSKGTDFFKKCAGCRSKRQKNDKKKYEVHHEKILEHKKDYYQENREEIRKKQKEYYDQNREYILASKAHTKKE